MATNQNEQERLTDPEEDDLRTMVALGEKMVDQGGQEVLAQAMESKDPAQIIGQFLMQLGSQLAEQLPFEVSPRIMLVEGGWVEQMSDFLQEEYGIPEKIMDRAEIYVGQGASEMAQGRAAQAQQQQIAPQGAPIPAAPLDGGMQ